jgi:hypothetical protein
MSSRLVGQDAANVMATVLGSPALLGMVDTWMQGRGLVQPAMKALSSQAVDEYFMWLALSNHIAQMANSASTVQKKFSAMDKLEEWLVDIKKTLLTATPQDIKSYLTHWSMTSGRHRHGPWQLCAPASVRVLASYLATEYDRYPTTYGAWNPRKFEGKAPSLTKPKPDQLYAAYIFGNYKRVSI